MIDTYVTCALKYDTVQHSIYMIEDYIAYLYEELEMYKGSSRAERINKRIEECKASLNELKLSVQQANEKE